MPDYISWYVIELKQRLAPHLPLGQVDEITQEAESHLREAVIQLQSARQPSDTEAAKAVISAFGTPAKVAATHLRESNARLFGIRPIWFVAAGALISTWCWVFEFISLHGYWDNFGDSWQNGLAGIVGFLGLILFVVGCRFGLRSYRRTVLGLGAAAIVLLPLLLSSWMISTPGFGQGISRLHLSRDASTLKRSLRRLDDLEAYLHEGVSVFGGEKWPKQVPLAFTSYQVGHDEWGIEDANLAFPPPPHGPSHGVIAPNEYPSVMVDGRIWSLKMADDVGRAMMYWRRNGPTEESQISSLRVKVENLIASAEEARHGRLVFWNPDVFAEAVFLTATWIPVLLLLEAITYWSVRQKRGQRRMQLA